MRILWLSFVDAAHNAPYFERLSRYLNEIAAICDGVTVLRDGVDVAHVDARTTPTEALVTAMIGAQAEAKTSASEARTPPN